MMRWPSPSTALPFGPDLPLTTDIAAQVKLIMSFILSPNLHLSFMMFNSRFLLEFGSVMRCLTSATAFFFLFSFFFLSFFDLSRPFGTL